MLTLSILILLLIYIGLRFCIASKYNKKYNMLILFGSGGHTYEMLMTLKNYDFQKKCQNLYFMHSYADTQEPLRVAKFIEDNKIALPKVEWITIHRSRKVKQSYLSSIITTIKATLHTFLILLRFRDLDIFITNGPGTCIPVVVVLIAQYILFIRKRCKILFIESWCRVENLSLSGKLLYWFSDRFVVNWESLCKKYKRATFVVQQLNCWISFDIYLFNKIKKQLMFKNSFQSGFLSILYSIGSKPLQIWDKQIKNGHIKRITDQDIQSSVLEIMGTNVSTNFITAPADPKETLGIKLPFLVMIIKNLKKYFTFEVQVLDDKNVRRRFRASNYQSTTRVKPFICTMPMRLDEGWNQIQFNLSDFTRRAYGTNYIETLRVQIHANCRIRRIYFSDRLYSEEELPPEFKLFLPIQKQG
ncbi:unnamed protein product [Paramecium primaurelia]|uniref:CFA20 domain-containing protein n=1 Tax=Paramecium primaurelia TaxID=5886 RepID=A0A8S1KT47_PARPR|nr:unnamed protein product [Paramecium primaurelia]